MEKVILVGINAKYIHTNIGIRYIKKYVEANSNYKVDILEWTINNYIYEIIAGISEYKPDVVGFSVYIWNKEMVFSIAKELKKILPSIVIIAGGPEVSYNGEEILNENADIDFIISGEGEENFKNIIEKNYLNKTGIFFRENNKVVYKEKIDYVDLDKVPFPYDKEDMESLANRIVYYESSRGCPFNCAYCLSSIDRRVRYFNIERVKKELKFFIENKVKLVKFVDRTFNLKKAHYLTIWKFLLDNYSKETSFHFEISAELFDEEDLEFLKKVPKNYFQFEIGIQSTNKETLLIVNRSDNVEKTIQNCTKIGRNIHLHLDLIAGLPLETYNVFKKSFNNIYLLQPDEIQLGFLKILKGTEMETIAKKHKYKFFDFQPFEIIENQYISFYEILKLKKIEKAVDVYYNSGRFKNTIKYIEKYFETSFGMFEEIVEYFEENKYFEVSHKPIKYFEYIYNFLNSKSQVEIEIVAQFLKFDFLLLEKPGFFPEWYDKKNDNIDKYSETMLEKFAYLPKNIFKKSEYETFKYNVVDNKPGKIELLFLYGGGKEDEEKNSYIIISTDINTGV